ncbi:MAG: serine/threonine protein kinase [Cyanobacteria bacterium HKST-UBA02]|nr:serine/threonine protein kinase [Cyanobacteria bacterium HKST-UBA02]
MKRPELPDRYKILKVLGKGGMGTVFKARDGNLDKVVAIKVLRGDFAQTDQVSLQRFQREAVAAGKLKHDNLISVLDFGVTDESHPYLVMDYVEGPTFKSLIESPSAIALEQALDIFCQVASGMSHAHQNGVVHRDLKPANIVLSRQEDGTTRAIVIDFGIARMEEGGALTRTDAIVGSPLYMSPEQVRGEEVDARADIYSLGCIMFECLTGRPPFQGATALDTMNMHVSRAAPSINENRPDDPYPQSLENIVTQSLARSLEKRYQSMAELLTDLEKVKEELSLAPVSPAGEAPARRQGDGLMPVFAIAGVVLIATVAFIVLTLFPAKEPESPAPLKEAYRMSKDRESTMAELKLELKEPGKQRIDALREGVIDRAMLVMVEKSGRTKLDARSAKFDNPADLSVLSKLRWLKASYTNIGDVGIRALSGCKDLDYLDITSTDVSRSGLEVIAGFEKLTWLQLDYPRQLKPADLLVLKRLPLLRTLETRHFDFDDKSLIALSELRHLRKIHLSPNSALSEEGIEKFKKATGCVVEIADDDPGRSAARNKDAEDVFRIRDNLDGL